MSCEVLSIPGEPTVRGGGGRARVIVCHIRRRPRACEVKASPSCTSGEYECDGCDAVMCRSCAVTVKPGGVQRDFCPRCFAPVWKKWLTLRTTFVLASTTAVQREERRRLFREWAHAHPEEFVFIKLTEAATR